MADLRLALLCAARGAVRNVCLLIAVFVTIALSRAAEATEITIPASNDVVVDDAGVVDAATNQRITALFVHLRQLTSAEVKVLSVVTTSGEDMPAFAQRHFDLWHLGQRGKDNGALIVLAVTEHQVRIHTGYGLESTLPDSWCGSLSRNVAASYFKAGKYGEGLDRMALAVAARIADAEHVDLNLDAASRFTPSPQGPSGFPWLMVIFIVIAVLLAWRHRRSGSYSSSPWSGSYGGFGGSGSGASSSFGGGFGSGGFSGGGGRSGGGGGGASW